MSKRPSSAPLDARAAKRQRGEHKHVVYVRNYAAAATRMGRDRHRWVTSNSKSLENHNKREYGGRPTRNKIPALRGTTYSKKTRCAHCGGELTLLTVKRKEGEVDEPDQETQANEQEAVDELSFHVRMVITYWSDTILCTPHEQALGEVEEIDDDEEEQAHEETEGAEVEDAGRRRAVDDALPAAVVDESSGMVFEDAGELEAEQAAANSPHHRDPQQQHHRDQPQQQHRDEAAAIVQTEATHTEALAHNNMVAVALPKTPDSYKETGESVRAVAAQVNAEAETAEAELRALQASPMDAYALHEAALKRKNKAVAALLKARDLRDETKGSVQAATAKLNAEAETAESELRALQSSPLEAQTHHDDALERKNDAAAALLKARDARTKAEARAQVEADRLNAEAETAEAELAAVACLPPSPALVEAKKRRDVAVAAVAEARRTQHEETVAKQTELTRLKEEVDTAEKALEALDVAYNDPAGAFQTRTREKDALERTVEDLKERFLKARAFNDQARANLELTVKQYRAMESDFQLDEHIRVRAEQANVLVTTAESAAATKIAELKADIEREEDRITKLEADVKRGDERVAVVKAEVAQVQRLLESEQGRLQDVRAQLDAEETRRSSLNAQVEETEHQLAALKAQQDDTKAHLAKLQADVKLEQERLVNAQHTVTTITAGVAAAAAGAAGAYDAMRRIETDRRPAPTGASAFFEARRNASGLPDACSLKARAGETTREDSSEDDCGECDSPSSTRSSTHTETGTIADATTDMGDAGLEDAVAQLHLREETDTLERVMEALARASAAELASSAENLRREIDEHESNLRSAQAELAQVEDAPGAVQQDLVDAFAALIDEETQRISTKRTTLEWIEARSNELLDE